MWLITNPDYIKPSSNKQQEVPNRTVLISWMTRVRYKYIDYLIIYNAAKKNCFSLNSSESDGDRRITDKCLTGGSRIHHAFYIILLDNFMGPTLGEEKKGGKHSSKLCTLPPTPPSPFLPTLWSATVRAILCWFTGWEDGNCCWTVLQDGRVDRGGQKLENRGGEEGQCL